MAKRKDSVALFEVITATKRKAAADGEAPLRTPKWWFRNRARPGDAAAGQPPAQETKPDVFDPTAGAVLPSPYVSARPAAPPPPPPPVAVEPPPAPVAGPLASPAEAPAAPAVVHRAIAPASYAPPAEVSEPRPVTVEIPPADRPRRNWFGSGIKKLRLDPDRQEVTLRFRYTTAIVATFAVAVVVVLAYVTGRRTSPPVAGPHSPSTEEIRNGEILAGVLGVGGDDRAPLLEGQADHPAQPEADRTRRPPAPPPQPQGPGAPKAPANKPASGVETKMPRVIGLNYVIIQSWPEREDAEAARKALLAANIPCTVEPTPPNFGNPRWWSVIGTHGFARPKSMPEFKEYVASIKAVSKTFAGKSKYKSFDPQAMRWR